MAARAATVGESMSEKRESKGKEERGRNKKKKCQNRVVCE